MTDQILLGLLAIVLGVVIGIALFVPFVAITYRRRGRLGFWRFVAWASALVYFWSIWTYTLLPLPDPGTMVCAGVNLQPFAFVQDIRAALSLPGAALTNPALMQVVLNVLLFVPLGFFLRVLGARGVLIALAVGLGVSAFIETTQLTGVWGLYPCAYRVFDVDDMILNTSGALLGSVLGLFVPRRLRGFDRVADADEPRAVTRGRRLLGMLCDALVVWLGVILVSTLVQSWFLYVAGDEAAARSGAVATLVGTVTMFVVWSVVVLATGRSVGDYAVQLEYRGGRIPVWTRRILRIVGGAGGWILLGLLPDGWSGFGFAFALTAVALVLFTNDGRGLPGLLTDQVLADARDPREEPAQR